MPTLPLSWPIIPPDTGATWLASDARVPHGESRELTMHNTGTLPILFTEGGTMVLVRDGWKGEAV